jgi:L-lysine exporter family protein LysE/ArgO
MLQFPIPPPRCIALPLTRIGWDVESEKAKAEKVMVSAFLHGLILSFGLILQPGSSSLLIVSQSAVHNRWQRIAPIVLGVVAAEALLILLAVNGASAVLLTLPGAKLILVLGGALFLTYTGWVTWRSKNVPVCHVTNQSISWNPCQQALLGFSIAFFDPSAILDIFGFIGMASLSHPESHRISFTVACILVSLFWFVMLALTGHLIGNRRSTRKLVNRFSALALWANAAYLLHIL